MKKLRKILSVLALIVLVGSDFLTSFSYALDDMLEDSVVVQTENEEETESVENEEDNVDEEDTEFAYEDESIEEELETENLTGNIVEEGTGKVSEIGSGEVEELTEETVEGVTGDIIEELTGDVEELTGDVDESTEIGEETVIEEITYNEEPIIGEETYNDVTVRVEALSGIFPEGTELKIEPIKWWSLSSLKDKLVEEKEEIKEDTTIVAFDITFRYEGEEVQPKDGEKVKVTFDYSKNENLLEADKNENQEVKVYHIEDMDNNGEKVNQGEEVVKDVTNKVESEEEGIAVVDAESFSIYAVVTTTGNPDSVTVTHYLNGGYWMEDYSTESKPIIYTCINNSCTTTTHYKTPSKDGYMFMGWINGSGNRRKDGVATDGMSVYAKWQKFGDLNVYILGSDNDSDKHQYTLMDRNMGALDIYNKSGTINDESRGYYYQWGNNYGFDSHYENSGALSETTKQKVDVANYSWEFPYYGYKFYLNGAKEYANWMSGSVNKSLWGDGNITSKEAKQGPCPAGYYIPSKNDWQGLLVSWNSVNSRAEKNFYFDFLVPSAGIRDRGYQQGNGSKVVDIERYRYASSSRNNNDTKTKAVITLTQTEMDKVPIVSPSSNNNNLSHERGSNGLSVRCFKNVTGSIINISDIDLNGGQKAIISIDSGEVVSLQNPVRNSDEFRGWYTTSNFSGNPIGVGSGLSVGDKLYARRCADGLVDDGTQCIDGYSITFDSNGGSPVATQTVSPLGTGTRPTDPTKMGYVFTGWFLTGAIEEFDFTGTQITGNIILYAHWNTGESYFKINCNKKKLDVDNNQLLDKSDPYLTGIVITGATDSEIILADYSNRCNLAGYEYTGAMVYGSDDGSGSKLSTTTLLADGTRVIEMYFQPVQNQFTLNSADYIITVGSSQNGLYYYGAKVTLSGDSSDDCFEWNEWNGLPEGTTSSAQTSFSMPNDSVTVTPSVKENTYNIIFSGNGSSSGEMSRINEVRCTESIQLTPNAFGKTGYTFTGWSRASGENTREYSDGQTVSGLSKTNLDDVTLYAVWDINKYIVTGSVAEGQENMGYLSGSTSTGASLTGLYDFGTNLIFIAIPELGYVFDYWKNGDTILSGTDLGDGTNQLTVIVDQILDIIAFFKPAENTPYTVEHYKQNLTQDGYEFAWSGTMYGTTNESTNATGTDYEGFTLSGSLVSYQTGINADGSTVVRLYYDRNTYTVMWDMWEGYPSWTVKKFDVIYGSHPVFEWDDVDQYTPKRGRDPRTDDIKYDFTFTGWVKSGSSEIIKDLTTQIVTGDVRYVAQYDTGYRYYEVRYHTDEGTGTMEPQSLQLYSSGTLTKNKFIRTGYEFSGWWYEYSDGIEVFYEDEQEINLGVEDGVLKSGGEWEDPLYLDVYAQWKPSTDTKVTVNYYLKDLDVDNNVLIDSTTEYAIGVEFTGITDEVINSILSTYGTGIEGYEYSKSIVYGPDYPTGVETGTTTILADGSRVIDMYYVPSIYQFILNSATNSSTQGSSESTGYYYGANVRLSGDSSDDCFEWSGWNGLPEGVENSKQTEFYMPMNAVTISSSVKEKTYNIIFNGNGSNSGIMPPMNGVRCTESTGLTLNSFERDGYTFTGWSTIVGGSIDYTNGGTVSRLSTGDGSNVTLYAVWDINKYNVNASVLSGNEGYLSGMGSTGISLIGLYDYGTELIFIAIPELGYVFDYWKNGSTVLSGTDLGDGTNQLTVVVDQILDIIAFFKPADDTPYIVEHYKQNLDQTGYEFAWSGTMYGTTNESTNATGTDYEGFSLSGSLVDYQIGIKADGSTIVRLYYDRDTYTVTWKNWNNETMSITNEIYGAHPVFESDGMPQRMRADEEIEYDFIFTGWIRSGTTEIIRDLIELNTEVVTGNVTYIAQYDQRYRYYEVRYNPNGGTGKMENQMLQLNTSGTLVPNAFTKTGYEFRGRSARYIDDFEGFYEDEQTININIYQDVEGDREGTDGVLYLNLYAQWKPSTDTKVIVNYYLKDLDKENNVLIDSRTEYAIGIVFTGTTDSIINSILTKYGTGIEGYEYSKSIVYGSDLDEHGIETGTTTVLADGSRVIDMYYVPVKNQFTLNSATHTNTAGSSQNGLYYYGAKVTLSGDSNNDCFMWSGWMTSGITLSDVTSHQTWFAMPANDVEITPSTTEKAYNIIFNGNGSNSGTMSPMNGVRCTESTGLTLNSFERDGYTFTGWSETSGGSRDYVDGATVDRLSTGVNVNLYAVWDVNHYTVTFDLNGGNLTGDMTETKDYTIETSSISLIDYEPERNGYTFTGWYRNDVLVNSIAGGETGDYTLVARWEAQRRPVPVVVYKKMLIPGEWSEYESELMWGWGTVGELYTAPLENFTPTGFHYEEENDSNRRTVVVDPDLRNEVAIFFARNLYPVIIDNAGEGRSSDTSGSSDYLYEEPVTISVTPYTGWEFINWTLIQGTLSGITDWTQRTLSFNMPAEQVMISPILDHIPYTVSFDTASGTTVENQTYYYDDVLSGLNSAITTRTGYNFDGWYLSGVLYTSGSTMPAENITLTAKWAPCTGVQYQVNHRGENTGDNNYEVLLSGYIMYGTSDTQTIAKSEEFAGFTLSGNVEQKTINPNGTTEVNIYYNRNVYTVSLDNNGGTGVSEITGKYQSAIAKPDDPNRLGYNFAGWDPLIPDTMPLNGGESTAKWNPGLTQYTVNYHIEKVQTGEYDIYTGVYAGETDSSPWIPLLNPSLTGFITPAQFTGKIIPGGTEFDYYYDRDSYMLYYDTAGGTPIPGKSFRYGEKILTGETQRPGYTLIKWNNIPEDGNMPAQSGLTLVALREPDAHTKYTVYHYFESLSGGYVTGNVQPLSGTTDTLTTARPISVPGYKTDFDIGDEEHTGGQVNIDGDGNAHVEIYYDRIVYQIAFDMNGGDAIQGTGVKFGTYIKSFIDSLNPHKKGYAFSGWNPEFPTAMPDRNLTGIAMWTPATGEYKVEFYYQRADGTYSSTATREELRTGKTEWVGRVKNSDKEPSIAGYAFDSTNTGNVLEGQIVGDGSLVLKVYFKKQFTVRYLTGSHGTFSEDVHPNLDYGVGTPVFRGSTGSHDSGYTFLGWDPELTGVVVEDRDYIAQWKADSDTEFKVEYYLQNVEDDGYTFAETGLQTGTTNTTGYADTMKEFTGFIFSGGNQNNVTSGLIAGDGSLVLKLYYDRKEYNVTTGEVEHGTMEGGAGSQRYGKRIIFTAHPDAGYVISKWLRDGNEILSGGVIWTGEELEVEVDTGMEISVEFEARNDTPYYVEYYKENLGGGYDIWTGTYSGTTDQEAVAQELSFTGFTYDSGDERNERTGNIDGDGSRVLRLYYTRNTNNVVYVYTGKVPSGQVVPETTGYKYEATVIVAEAPNVLGYNFSWSTGVSSFTMPDEKVVITGTWTANTGTKYAVQHMLQNIEDDGYTQTGEDQILSGETDELTNAQANNYTGFTVQSFSQTGIKGDESTIVVIKYDRKEYNVTTGEVEHGTMEGGAGSQRYGKRITFTAHPDAGYLISKWLRDGNEILSGGVIWTGEELEVEVDTGMEISVEFEARNDTPYYVEYYKENLEGGYEVWTGTYSGTTDQEAVAQELSFTGFTFSGGNQSNITSGVIAGDGSLVLKLFYDRNKYTITWKDGNDEVLKTDQLFYGAMPEYTGETPTKTATAQYSYIFNNTWTPAIEIVTTGVTYTAQFDVEVNKYLITFVDGDGKIVQSGMVVYGEVPQYTGTTPTKTATAQYSYTFNNTWTPAIESVITGVTYTAQFDSTVNEYTISIVPSDTDMGTVSPSEINVSYGSAIVESGNIITVGGVEVKATPKSADVQYTYEFDSWTNTCGSELVGTCTIQANFKKTLNKYSITWRNDDGSLIDTTMVEYGATPTHTKPTKAETEQYRYVFAGWTPEVVAVVGNAEYTAVFNAEEKEKHSEGGNMSGGGGRKSTIDNAENSDNQHGSAEENSDLFTGGYYVSSGNVDEETLSLYEWAHENDITTIDTLEEANAYGYLTRGHMAKIAVNFAEKILGKTVPDVYPDECNWNDKESERESQEIKVYAKKACALGVMGINVEEFMPNKILNRAEFGTTVSRLLWGDKYNIIDTDHRFYYEDHLYALKKQGIMTQINDPEARRELRKWVRLVFRRITEKLKK